jgi:murein DD-endopeptidase MepM/ murein hydrolase activator NlpD
LLENPARIAPRAACGYAPPVVPEPEPLPKDGVEPTTPSLLPTSDAPELPPLPPPRGVPRVAKIAGSFLCGAVAAVLIVYTIEARAKRAQELAAQAAGPTEVSAPALVLGGADASDDGAATDGGVAASADAAPMPIVPVWRIAEMKGDPSVDFVEGIVGKRPFSTALIVTGVARAEMQRVVKAFQDVRSFDRVGPKDTFVVAKEKKTGHLVAFEFATSPGDVWQARETTPGVLEGRKLALVVERVRVAVGVVVEGDLRASVVKAGLDDDLLDQLDDALEGHAELADLRPGARLRVVATEERVQGKFTRYVEIDAVEYSPASGAPPVRVYHHGTGKAPGFYDAKAQRPYRGGWRTPVPLARISSRYNPRRMHPVLHVVMPHNGIDFAASPGTPVYSSAAGSISSVGDGGPCGNMVQIKHANGLTTAYCHLQRFAPGLHPGLHVEQRQLVGFVGQTGRATGPHLHFAVKRGDIFMDPLALKLDGVRVLPPEDRDDFNKTRMELDGVLEAIAMGGADGGALAAPVSVPLPATDGGPEDMLDEAP